MERGCSAGSERSREDPKQSWQTAHGDDLSRKRKAEESKGVQEGVEGNKSSTEEKGVRALRHHAGAAD